MAGLKSATKPPNICTTWPVLLVHRVKVLAAVLCLFNGTLLIFKCFSWLSFRSIALYIIMIETGEQRPFS